MDLLAQKKSLRIENQLFRDLKVTLTEQFTNHFMQDLKKLAMWNPF
tara:strand:+ start:65 stop:202 length:138 start_codon:yes stop_codon:yes gene_type:complete